jgi:hypothetical protein
VIITATRIRHVEKKDDNEMAVVKDNTREDKLGGNE